MFEPDRIAVVSGGFDPLRAENMEVLNTARHLGRIEVLLLSDSCVVQQNGSIVLPWGERAELLRLMPQVWAVHHVHAATTGLRMLRERHPHARISYVSYKGKPDDGTPEAQFYQDLNIEVVNKAGADG
jgi:glycerol-3-phosphate cytidylyltransferase-like family protein